MKRRNLPPDCDRNPTRRIADEGQGLLNLFGGITEIYTMQVSRKADYALHVVPVHFAHGRSEFHAGDVAQQRLRTIGRQPESLHVLNRSDTVLGNLNLNLESVPAHRVAPEVRLDEST